MNEQLNSHETKVLLEFSGVTQDGLFYDDDTRSAIAKLKKLGLLSQGTGCYITQEGKQWLLAN